MSDLPIQGLKVMRRSLFLVSLPLFYVTFALPIQSKNLGANALEIGALFSLFTFSILLMRPLIGAGIDRFGRRNFFLFSIVFYFGAYLAYTFASEIEVMFIARFFQGIGASLLLITVDTMTADEALEEERGEAMGKNVEVQTRASVVGATIGFTLIGAVPALAWTYSFGLFSILAAGAFLYALNTLPETRPAKIVGETNEFEMTLQLKKLLLIYLFLGFASALAMPIYMIYLQDEYTTNMNYLAWAFLPAAVIMMVLPSKLGRFVDGRDPVKLMSLAIFLSAMFYIWMPLTNAFWYIVVVYTFSNIAWALIGPTRKSLTVSSTSSSGTARAFGVSEMAFGAGATIGPLVGGYMYDQISHAAPFYFNGFVMMIAAILSLLLLRSSNGIASSS
ncbi:MAG: DHA1 family multidrug resistance protein-like MFS transporter [Candidatus Azotimanducaceae bacterium]|jgi:DHA1 family multidrug resistance protein-like MFS transporter